MPSRLATLAGAILIIVLLVAPMHCQDVTKAAPPPPTTTQTAAPAPPLLSADDKFEGRTLQLKEAQALAAVQQSAPYQAAVAAQSRRAAFFQSLFAKYKLDPAKYQPCDGPGGAGQPGDQTCKGVAEGDIVWRAIVKPVAAKATEPTAEPTK